MDRCRVRNFLDACVRIGTVIPTILYRRRD